MTAAGRTVDNRVVYVENCGPAALSLPPVGPGVKWGYREGDVWDEDDRHAAGEALEEVPEGRMAAREVADRRNGSSSRWLMTALGEIEFGVPRARIFSPLQAVCAYARRAAHVDRVILACFVRGLSTCLGRGPRAWERPVQRLSRYRV